MATYLSLSARVVSKSGYPELIPNDLAEHFIRFTERLERVSARGLFSKSLFRNTGSTITVPAN
jgi:hypothetical protein